MTDLGAEIFLTSFMGSYLAITEPASPRPSGAHVLISLATSAPNTASVLRPISPTPAAPFPISASFRLASSVSMVGEAGAGVDDAAETAAGALTESSGEAGAELAGAWEGAGAEALGDSGAAFALSVEAGAEGRGTPWMGCKAAGAALLDAAGAGVECAGGAEPPAGAWGGCGAADDAVGDAAVPGLAAAAVPSEGIAARTVAEGEGGRTPEGAMRGVLE